MKLYSQIRNLLVVMLILNCIISIRAEQDEDSLSLKIEKRFFEHVDKVVNGGRLKRIWDQFLKNGISENTDTEDEANLKKTSSSAQLLATMSTIGFQISKELMENSTNSTDGRSIRAETQAPAKLCPFLQNKKCDPNDIFRSIDGSCNNLEFPLLGKASTPYKRYLPPAYGDGLETARSKGKSGKDLPNPRVVSSKLFKDNFQFDNEHTHIIAFFGQFITHDFSLASVSVGINNY